MTAKKTPSADHTESPAEQDVLPRARPKYRTVTWWTRDAGDPEAAQRVLEWLKRGP